MRQNCDIEHILKLTLAVYKVTGLFPEEGLKHQIRESANKILADFLYNQDENCSRTIKGLLGLFNEAEAKDWVDPRNFLVLYREYDRLLGLAKQPDSTKLSPPGESGTLRSLGPFFAKAPEGSPSPISFSHSRKELWRRRGKIVENSFLQNSHRQGKILKMIQENGKIKVSNISQLFPQLSRRTIIRDLDRLCRMGAVIRIGNNGRGVYYTKNSLFNGGH